MSDQPVPEKTAAQHMAEALEHKVILDKAEADIERLSLAYGYGSPQHRAALSGLHVLRVNYMQSRHHHRKEANAESVARSRNST